MKLPSKEVDYIKYIFHLLSRTVGLERPKGGFGNVAWPGRAELICIKEKHGIPKNLLKVLSLDQQHGQHLGAWAHPRPFGLKSTL